MKYVEFQKTVLGLNGPSYANFGLKKYQTCSLEICWTVTMMTVIFEPSQTFSFKEVNVLELKRKKKQEQ